VLDSMSEMTYLGNDGSLREADSMAARGCQITSLLKGSKNTSRVSAAIAPRRGFTEDALVKAYARHREGMSRITD
jgi:hypothetical protein